MILNETVLEYTTVNGKIIPKKLIRKISGKLADFISDNEKCCTFGEINLEENDTSLSVQQKE